MIVVRPARRDDLERLVEIENAAFDGDRLSRASLARYLRSSAAAMLVATAGAAVVGYALIGWRRGARTASLYSIAVDAQAGGRGAGRALLIAAERATAARGFGALTLEVRADNARAIALYEKLGYERFGAIPDYYEDGATACRFRKALAPA